jgi:hypothetical protein
LLDPIYIVLVVLFGPVAFASYLSIIWIQRTIRPVKPVLKVLGEHPEALQNLLSGNTSAISAALDNAMVKAEEHIVPMAHNAIVEAIDNGAFDGLVERYGEDLVALAQTLGQNLAAVVFTKLKERTDGQAGGIQKGINYEERRQADVQFDQLVGQEGMAEAVDEFAEELGISPALARNYAPMFINWVKRKFGHMIPGQNIPPQSAAPPPYTPSNGPRGSIWD